MVLGREDDLVRVEGREAANDGTEVINPVELGLMRSVRSVEWLRLILCSFCVEKKAMGKRLKGNRRAGTRAGRSKPISL